MENTKLVTYHGAGKRVIMTTTKRRELAQTAATKAENFVEQNLLFDEEIEDDRAFTFFAIGSFGAALAITATIFVESLFL